MVRMKKFYLPFSMMVLCFVLTGCGTKMMIHDQAELNEVEGVSMTIKNGTLTRAGATIMITDVSDNNYDYGEFFRLERKENGIWKEVPIINPDYGFHLIAYHVNDEHQLELNQNWEYFYGKLKDGEYRLVKYVYPPGIQETTKEEDRRYFSVEFTIEKL